MTDDATDPAPNAPRSGDKEFTFAIVAVDPRDRGIEGLDEVADALFMAGCDDATPSFQHGVHLLDFDRRARNFGHAVASALADVRRAGLTPIRVEPDEVVNAADIARRAAVSRQAVSKWFRDLPSPPPPAHGASGGAPLYDWARVASWLHANGQRRISVHDVVRARLTKRINAELGYQPAGRRTSGRKASDPIDTRA